MNGLVFPFSAVYFKFISKEWKYLFIYIFLPLTVIITLFSHFVPESPKFLYEKGRYSEAKAVIQKMGRMNKVEGMAEGKWEFISHDDRKEKIKIEINESTSETSFLHSQLTNENNSDSNDIVNKGKVRDKESPFKIMRNNPIIFINLIIIMLSWISTSFNTYLLGFSIRNLDGNLYFNAWAFGLCGIIGKL